ncbi:MAG: hypothetical protein M3X11_26220, partial [Acidobacteriota bacterium]|nr:hypothetical protein [Acidobacteriota bacterium]
MSKLPPAVKIGAYDFKFICNKGHEADAHGEIYYVSQEIFLSSKFPSPERAVDTVLHEIFHGLWHQSLLKRKEREEPVVTTMATGLTQVFRDNPKLLEWIRDSLKR